MLHGTFFAVRLFFDPDRFSFLCQKNSPTENIPCVTDDSDSMTMTQIQTDEKETLIFTPCYGHTGKPAFHVIRDSVATRDGWFHVKFTSR